MAWKGNLPAEIPAGGIGQVFRDYIPAEEQHLYPGQGMGNTLDYVPEGYSADEFAEKIRLEKELKEFEDARQAKRRLAGGIGSPTATEEPAPESGPAAGGGDDAPAPAAVGPALEAADRAPVEAALRVRGRGRGR